MTKDVDNELDRLLSGGGLSGPEEDMILRSVLGAVRAEKEAEALARPPAAAPKPSILEQLRSWFILPPVAIAAAAAAFLLWPSADDAGGQQGFTTRGSGEIGSSLTASCRAAGQDTPCAPGRDLVLGWRAKAAVRVTGVALGPDQALLWLFVDEPVSAGRAFAHENALPLDLIPGAWKILLLTSSAEGPATGRDGARSRLERITAPEAPEDPGVFSAELTVTAVAETP